ncbi:MAG: ABC transporter substrate-binding protein [Nocardiopsaceae bacterium]|nr:ABC transporter substrate-binding protein [Nocardiopsaceae bacterium]
MKANKIAYRMIAVAGLTIGLADLPGCATTYDKKPMAPEQSTITVDSVPTAEQGGLYIAAADGFFKKQGLTVKIKPITGGEEAIPDIQSGKAQIVGGNYVSFVLAEVAGRANGKPASFRVVAPACNIQPGSEALYVRPGSPYKSVAALAENHATVGLNTPRGVGQVMLGALMQDNGYSLGDVHQVLPPSGFPALVSMLRDGRVDAAWLPQPFATVAQQQYGAVQIADFDQGSVQDFPFTGYIGATNWVRTHPSTVAAFTRALAKGQQVADTNRKALEDAMEKYAKLPPIVADTMPYDTYPLNTNDTELQRVSNAMFEFGLTPGLKRPYRMASMLSPGHHQLPSLTVAPLFTMPQPEIATDQKPAACQHPEQGE